MAAFTNTTKNSVSVTNSQKTLAGNVLATAGLYYGFGAFTYSGGETLSGGSLPVFTNPTKNNAIFTNLIKN